MRPWENVAPRPWEIDQGIYDRTVAIHRSRSNAGQSGSSQVVGLVGYSGREQTTAEGDANGEDVLFTGLAASIQDKRANTKSGQLPADTTDRPMWTIFIPVSAGVAQYAIRDRDIVVDDESYRYMVTQNRWTGFGYKLNCTREEA